MDVACIAAYAPLVSYWYCCTALLYRATTGLSIAVIAVLSSMLHNSSMRKAVGAACTNLSQRVDDEQTQESQWTPRQSRNYWLLMYNTAPRQYVGTTVLTIDVQQAPRQ